MKRAGHKCGDEVLAKVAKVMVDNVRSNDYCVRFSGGNL
ncbi:diguanylate cyclase domain-containing protein [Photobacterium kasasachensis]